MADLPARQAENIQFVLKGANHLLALINDALDLSRIETGQLKMSPEIVMSRTPSPTPPRSSGLWPPA